MGLFGRFPHRTTVVFVSFSCEKGLLPSPKMAQNMSPDVAWAIIRDRNCYMMKARNVSKPFSTHPANLTNKHAMRYDGIVNNKAVIVEPASDDKGFNIVTKTGHANKPAKSLSRTAMKTGKKNRLACVKSMMGKQRYRKDLTKAVLRRASAIIRSQKPLPKRKGSGPKKAKADA